MESGASLYSCKPNSLLKRKLRKRNLGNIHKSYTCLCFSIPTSTTQSPTPWLGTFHPNLFTFLLRTRLALWFSARPWYPDLRSNNWSKSFWSLQSFSRWNRGQLADFRRWSILAQKKGGLLRTEQRMCTLCCISYLTFPSLGGSFKKQRCITQYAHIFAAFLNCCTQAKSWWRVIFVQGNRQTKRGREGEWGGREWEWEQLLLDCTSN